MSESPPDIIIFSRFANHMQALQYVDDIIYPPTLNFKLQCDLVKLQHVPIPTFEAINKLSAKFLQTTLLAVVGQDLGFDVSAILELTLAVYACALFCGDQSSDEYWLVGFDQQIDQICVLKLTLGGF